MKIYLLYYSLIKHLDLIVWVTTGNKVLTTHLKRVRASELSLLVAIFEGVGLKVKELEVVSSFIPLILVIVLTWSWLQGAREVLLETGISSELEVVPIPLRAQLFFCEFHWVFA